eukprot:TRINITY_DN8953_c0_g4_i1.p1 TRINITY_DN8953_c0_g4~~TRINITY_DN8953_c0_g4_i1.p1  ORF type:complete len:439 (-),score=61.03 TRINITY_DN8953_c0_g4_i1:267-1583(-)
MSLAFAASAPLGVRHVHVATGGHVFDPSARSVPQSQVTSNRTRIEATAILALPTVALALSHRKRYRRPKFQKDRSDLSAICLACVASQSKPGVLRYPGSTDAQESRKFALELAEFLQTGARWNWQDAEVLVKDAIAVLSKESTLEHVKVAPSGHVNVVGDVHGQFFDLFTIFEQNGLPSEENPYIFNGDFVDRGSFSVEVLLLLLAWKVALPSHFRLARGNHEDHEMNVPYGFTGEVLTKYGPEAYNLFQEVFDNLPLAHVVNHDVLIVHGGLPREQGVGLSEIESLDRAVGSKSNVFTDLLWADPRLHQGMRPSKRGGNVVTFGPDVTQDFLEKNHLSLLIRSHEVKDEGFEWQHAKRCLTVFSAPLYCDSCDNKGAVIRLSASESGEGPLGTEVRTFDARPKPDFYIPAMAYSPLNPDARRFLSPQAKQILQQFYG